MSQIQVPKGWNIEPLKNMCDFYVPMRDKPQKFDGDVPWLRIDEIKSKFIDGHNAKHRVSEEIIEKMKLRVYPVGTVLCSCSATIGVCAITRAEVITNQTFIGVYPKTKIFNEYLYYYLISKVKDLTKLGKGTTISYISRDKFENLNILFPPLETQKKIVQILDKKFAEWDRYKHQIESIEKQFQNTKKSLDHIKIGRAHV